MNKLPPYPELPVNMKGLSNDQAKVQTVIAALTERIGSRYKDRVRLASETTAFLKFKLGHHTDLRKFVQAAQVEALGDDLRAVASDLPLETEFDAILSAAEKARYNPTK